ncbi:MAG: sodium-translocating pyrophosphatase [Anaerolineae bacterium]|nr:sodium-translocating pyrophosphatase [Anaerolineae bacterium]MDW8170954.1 sodium-translocating pyrophosphatase [Anaerolineae bacterium]
MTIVTAAILGVIASLVGLGFAYYQRTFVLSQSAGNEKMQQISRAIQRGAQAFLSREYRAVGILVALVAVILVVLSFLTPSMSIWTAVAFVSGASASALAGYFGMYIAVRANVRTTQASSESLNKGLRVAFSSGTVMGSIVVSLSLLGISLLYILFVEAVFGGNATQASSALAGFGFGGTAIALFARVGGGIYTKAADVGADLVGKTEENIPEDDPRNPAVIADNVGDNVGDVAGMGSDLFESYASSIIAAISLAVAGGGIADALEVNAQMFPIMVAAAGIVVSIVASFLVQTKEGATQEMLLGSLRTGVYSASGLVAVAIFLLAALLGLPIEVSVATLAGLLAGVLIGYFTEYFTSGTYKPTQTLAQASAGGPAIVIIRGLALGMMSTLAPVLIVVMATLVASAAAGLYGIAMAAVGMLSTLGITLATDAYGPVADNAGGIAEMAGLPKEVRERTDALDALGNTTAATGKGFAIGSAAMTALALSAAVITALGLNETLTIGEVLLDPRLITGMFIGGLLPFVFSALTMLAVGNAAQGIVQEVRRQFREIKGLREGTAEPDYETCVGISTDSALRQMLLPGIIAVSVPMLLAVLTVLGQGNILGQFVGVKTLVGMLVGSLISAFMLAVMMSNAGGAWDNAKKYIEGGQLGGKGSDSHKAAVVGDTVGDPFKDTSGPSLNILLKLLAIVVLVIAPILRDVTTSTSSATPTDTAITAPAPEATPEATPGN